MPRISILGEILWEPYTNNSGQIVPPWGLIVLTTGTLVNGRIRWTADRPGTTFYRQFAINGPFAVPVGGKGDCTRSKDCYCVLQAGSAPDIGDGCGPKPSQFTAAVGFPGMTFMGWQNETDLLALVSLESPITQLYCKCTSAMTGGAVATGSKYDIMCGTADAETDSGFDTVPDVFIPGGDIAVDDFLWLTWQQGTWFGGKIC